MALSAEQETLAKTRAKEYLEWSIFNMCQLLDVDSATLDTSYTIPVASDHPQYNAHDCLKKQVIAHSKL